VELIKKRMPVRATLANPPEIKMIKWITRRPNTCDLKIALPHSGDQERRWRFRLWV